MAAGSDLLGDVFLSTEVDEKVVSDLDGSLESELTETRRDNTTARAPSAENHGGNSALGSSLNVQGSKMGLSQQDCSTLPLFSCVSAAAGIGAQGGVSNSTGSLGSSMDGAAGITSTAGPSVTATQSQSKSDAASGVVMVTLDATAGAGRPGATDAQTLNGGAVVMNCQITAGGPADSNNSQPGAVTLLNNGPVSKPSAAGLPGTPSTIIRATLNAQNVVTSSVISSQPSVKTVPTITLVRPPMQTFMNPSPSTGSPTTVLTSPSVSVTSTTGSPASKTDCPKVILPTGAHVVASVVATGTTVRSPTVLQGLRTSVPSTVAATPGGIRTIVPQVLAPRLAQPQQNAPNIQNIQLPPGMVLVRSESGQLLMIPQQALAQMQAQSQSQSAMTPRPPAPTSTPPVQITSLQAPGAPLLARPVTPTTIIKQCSTVQTTVTATTALQRPPVLENICVCLQETLENVKKCRNFLSTLIKLASSGKQSSETTANVKELVKNLLEAKIEPEDFTSRLYQELNSSPQPYLVPFLKRSLPALRQMTPDSEAFIQQSLLPQLSPQPAAAASTALTAVVLRPPLSTTITTTTSPATTKTTVISLTQTPHSKPGLVMDDDDINDVASMAGVNLSEESARILATNSELVGMVTRSCKDETFLSTSLLTRIVLDIGKKFSVSELGTDVINYISHATQQRLQDILEKVSHVAQQKNLTFKEDEQYEQASDVRTQLKFFEQLDQMEKQRKEEQEREILLKAAKSRSRQEDPEQLRLKQKAKEMQQQELAQIRQREANLTALAAIGPRKKRKMDSPGRGANAEGSGSCPSQTGGSGGTGSRQFMRQRITRVNLRDLLFCLENERGTSHSHLLYKGFLK
uniref:TATA-box binding protein associated factor 4 n=1 Tax=Maylandia zebra TaxID=106582 RepID=A0A3P9DK88_9CICH